MSQATRQVPDMGAARQLYGLIDVNRLKFEEPLYPAYRQPNQDRGW